MSPMGTNKVKKNLLAVALLVVFIGISFQCINELPRTRRSEYRSSMLRQVVTRDGNVTRTDYVDENGNLQIAANVGYARKQIVKQDNSETETYYDDHDEQISLYYGYYGILREYDTAGNNIRITYLDENNDPVVILSKYAVEERIFNEHGQQVLCRYLDAEGNPALSYNNCYGVRYEYDDKGRRAKITYIDDMGEPMNLSLGYSILVRDYYETDGPENGKVRKEYYYLSDGMPVSLSLGEYGIYKEYNDNGQTSSITYLDADGSPMVTNKGYTSVNYTYYADNTVQSTLYYDINGNPFQMSEGQYGTKNENGQTVYLNADGTEQFNIKNYVYKESRLVVVIAIVLAALSALTGKRINWIMLIVYIGVIMYFTLMFRETNESKIGILRSYGKFFVSSEARATILKNIWLFVPLGGILFQLYPQKTILFLPIFLSVIIEAVQYFTGMGMCELDDVISNGLGGAIGYGMGFLAKMIRR